MIWNHTVQRLLPVEEGKRLPLPESYVALKTYFSPAFPDTPENRELLRRVIDELATRTEIVLLRAPVDAEYHEEYVPDADAPVHDVRELLSPRTNLAVQTQIVREARVLVGTYGGFSYLGTYAGTPTVALYTRPMIEHAHLDAIDRVGRRLAEGSTRLFRARHVGAIPPATAPQPQ
jgi:ADP-heptose:LPS heptosyltransferase